MDRLMGFVSVLLAVTICAGLVALIGYNSGFNHGHDTALKYDPLCRDGLKKL